MWVVKKIVQEKGHKLAELAPLDAEPSRAEPT